MDACAGMIKLVVMTRGRTGSTAIIDQLGKASNIHSEQEIFSRDPNLKYYTTVLPFNEWRKNTVLRFFIKDEVRLADIYLNGLHRKFSKRGYGCFVWKGLSNSFHERPYLIELLKSNKYRAFYLKRNVACQVVSGMVANARGIYNSTEKIVDSNRYQIDIDKFRVLVEWEKYAINSDLNFLKVHGIEFMKIYYEDYVKDKAKFFNNIFMFTGLPEENIAETDFKIIIDNPSDTLVNFEQVKRAAEEMGEQFYTICR